MKPQDPYEIDAKTLAKLTSKKNEERIEAELEIAGLGDNAIPALLAALEREANTYRRSRNLYRGLWGFMGSLFTLYMLFGVYKGVAYGDWGAFSDWSSFLSFTGVLGGTGLVTQSHKNAVSKLVEFNDIRIVGPLLEARDRNDASVQEVSERTLIRLLPRLTASDSPLFNAEQLACMNRALKSKNSEFVVAVLKALEQVGDDTHLEQVERLAHQRTGNPFQERMRDSAIACLPYLRERAENAIMAKTLLRASAADMSPDMLLRPAGYIPDANPNELLRPIQPENSAFSATYIVAQEPVEEREIQRLG